MFHLQLRQFPRNHCQFNLTDEELRAIAEIWAGGRWLVIGERRWSPHQAKLKVFEGPGIPVQQLSMGRGWRQVERHGEDVTSRVVAMASASVASSATARMAATEGVPTAGAFRTGGAPAAREASEARQSPAGVVRTLLGGGPRAEALLAAWQDAASRFPERSPSECLALAEREIESRSGSSGR